MRGGGTYIILELKKTATKIKENCYILISSKNITKIFKFYINKKGCD